MGQGTGIAKAISWERVSGLKAICLVPIDTTRNLAVSRTLGDGLNILIAIVGCLMKGLALRNLPLPVDTTEFYI